MTAEEREGLIEEALSAHRERDTRAQVRSHPAWHDLPEDDRELVFDATLELRALEAALDRDGLSTTARAVLQRIGGRR